MIHRSMGDWILDFVLVKSETLFPVPDQPSDDFANWKVTLTDALAVALPAH